MFLNVAIRDMEKQSQKIFEALFFTTYTPMRTLRGVSKTLWGSIPYNSQKTWLQAKIIEKKHEFQLFFHK